MIYGRKDTRTFAARLIYEHTDLLKFERVHWSNDRDPRWAVRFLWARASLNILDMLELLYEQSFYQR